MTVTFIIGPKLANNSMNCNGGIACIHGHDNVDDHHDDDDHLNDLLQ